MRQHFPMLCNWLTVRRMNSKEIRITNDITDEEFITDQGEDYIQFIRKLNGKRSPYGIECSYSRREVAHILNELSEYGLLREDRWLEKSIGSIAYSLYIPDQKSEHSFAFKVMNTLLFLCFLPILLIGVVYFFNSPVKWGSINIPGIIIGLFAGLFLHECGHMIAARAYGIPVYELGLRLTFLCVPGAYVLLNETNNLPSIKRIQISAAGIQVNAVIAGIAFILAANNPYSGDIYFNIAITNASLVILNLTNITGNDGCQIISALFGEENDIVEIARQTIFDPQSRSDLLNRGSAGKATFCSYCIILLLQIAMPALIAANILEVVMWFG